MADSTHWELQPPHARLRVADLTASLDLLRPQRGLHDAHRGQRLLPGLSMLGVEPDPIDHTAPVVADAYTRGRDLVVTYTATAPRFVRTQVYWRVAECFPSGVLAAIDMQVSVQTSSWDSDPQVLAESTLPSGQVLRLLAGDGRNLAGWSPAPVEQRESSHSVPSCWLARLPGGETSYAEMVHAADVGRDELAGITESLLRLRHCLFVDPLEKGVILRARLRGLLLPRVHDTELAGAAYAEFLEAKPPLTT
jgi:hypothetical protein